MGKLAIRSHPPGAQCGPSAYIFCPACGVGHSIGACYLSEYETLRWSNFQARAVRVRDPAHPDQPAGGPQVDLCRFVLINGQIEYLASAPHAMAGQTVALPDWDEPAAAAWLAAQHFTD